MKEVIGVLVSLVNLALYKSQTVFVWNMADVNRGSRIIDYLILNHIIITQTTFVTPCIVVTGIIARILIKGSITEAVVASSWRITVGKITESCLWTTFKAFLLTSNRANWKRPGRIEKWVLIWRGILLMILFLVCRLVFFPLQAGSLLLNRFDDCIGNNLYEIRRIAESEFFINFFYLFLLDFWDRLFLEVRGASGCWFNGFSSGYFRGWAFWEEVFEIIFSTVEFDFALFSNPFWRAWFIGFTFS